MSSLSVSVSAPKEYPEKPEVKSDVQAEELKSENKVPKEESQNNNNQKVLTIWTYNFKTGDYEVSKLLGGNKSGLMINRGSSSVFLSGDAK